MARASRKNVTKLHFIDIQCETCLDAHKGKALYKCSPFTIYKDDILEGCMVEGK